MNPIFEPGKGEGIGYQITEFHERFDQLCREHLQSKRAKAFAFIFHTFKDDVRKILADQGAFAQLDRLSGDTLSIFYLRSAARKRVEYFNSHFLSKLGVAGEATPPCVVFFRLVDDSIEHVEVAQLNSANLMHGFHQLYSIIKRYVEAETGEGSPKPRPHGRISQGAVFISLEVFHAILKKALDHLL